MNKRLAPGMTAPDFTFDAPDKRSQNFRISADGGAVLFFLRYMGCPLCQLKIGEILRDHEKFKQAGVKVYVALQSSPETVREGYSADFQIPFTIICDPDEKVFRLYGVAKGNLFQYLAPSVIVKAVKASRAGFRHGKKEGQEMQLPAVHVVGADGVLTYAYYGKNIGDVPDNVKLLEEIARSG